MDVKTCYDEIIQRITWLLDDAAGGAGYIPGREYKQEKQKYIPDLERALHLFIDLSSTVRGKV